MELQLRPETIRAERERRAWTQEHLAELAGLGVRTIQRVESSGTASVESATALSAVLEIPLAALRADARAARRKSLLLDALVLVVAAFVAMLFVPPVPMAQVPVLIIVAAYFFGRRRAQAAKLTS
jgi:transcriptional regulator with XRE-family HTH domain